MATAFQNPKLPKHLNVVKHLRRQMESGALKPGDRLPSLAQLQKQFGVSEDTVERAQALLEQDGLIVRRHRQGTFVAEPQQRSATGIIGISMSGIIPSELRLPYYAQLIEGLREASARRGREVLLLNDSSVIRWEKMDGVVIYEHTSPLSLIHISEPTRPY